MSKPTDKDAPVLCLDEARRKANAEGLMLKTSRKGRYCAHKFSEVDERSRLVECRDCGAPLDPVTVLWKLACEPERYQWELDHLKREIAKHREELDAVLREERNGKARLRTLKKNLTRQLAIVDDTK